MNIIKLVIYYTLIKNLPHSRYWSFFNKLRCWYICNVLQIMESDKNNYFEYNIYIAKADHLSIGKHCHINENVFIQGASIGNFVMIAPNVAILSDTHGYDRTDIPMIMQEEKHNLYPVIEDDVWIGRNAVIMPNIRIGRSSIIGAGAVVTKDVEPFSVMGGVPAKLIKKRT